MLFYVCFRFDFMFFFVFIPVEYDIACFFQTTHSKKKKADRGQLHTHQIKLTILQGKKPFETKTEE